VEEMVWRREGWSCRFTKIIQRDFTIP